MKRALLENVRVVPYEDGSVIDRQGFLSAIFAAAVSDDGTLTITVAHCDTAEGTFETATDTRIAPLEVPTIGSVVGAVPTIIPGVYSVEAVDGDIVNIDLDFVGCKQFVTITTSGDAATDALLAYALGDAEYTPV